MKIRSIILTVLILASTGCERKMDFDIEDVLNDAWDSVMSIFGTPKKKPEKLKDQIKKLHPLRPRVFLDELYQVVLFKKPDPNSEEYRNWLNVLSQGASLEGVYNGFVCDVNYTKLTDEPAYPAAMQTFAEEMAYFENEYILITGLGKKSNIDSLIGKYKEKAIDKNIYQLKKKLGERVIKNMEALVYQEKLASWYALNIKRMLKYSVDYGFPYRNKKDEYYHYEWAMKVSKDRVHWEMLNRIQRILNEKNKGASYH